MIYLHLNTIYILGIVPGKLEGAIDSGEIEGTKENQRKCKKKD